MKPKFGRILTLALLAALLVALPVLVGCGGSSTGSNEVTMGWLADQTGPSAQSFREVMKGMDDYLAEMDQADPIPGVDVNVVTYDFRLELGRLTTGYQWLVNQGMDLLLGYATETSIYTVDDQADDKIPLYCFTAIPQTMDADWVYTYVPTYIYEARTTLDYLTNVWWPTQNAGRPLRVGCAGLTGYAAFDLYKEGYDWVIDQNPGKVTVKYVLGDALQTAWASEVSAIQDTDVVLINLVGTSSATFTKEIIARGYQGKLVGCTISHLGVWPMITSMCPKESLDGLIIPHYYPLWTDDTSYTRNLDAILQKSRPAEAAELRKGTTWISGCLTTQILVEAIRDAAANVGPDKVDGTAIRDAMEALDLEIEGMPNITLAGHGGHHVFQPYCRMIQYSAAQDDWIAITDWFMPPGFAS